MTHTSCLGFSQGKELCLYQLHRHQSIIFALEEPVAFKTINKVCQVWSATMSMLVAFFDICRIVRYEVVTQGQTAILPTTVPSWGI